MYKQAFLKAALLISLLVPAGVSAQTSEQPDGMRILPDVVGQFKLARRAGGATRNSHWRLAERALSALADRG